MEPDNIIIIIIDTLREDYAKPLENILINYGFISCKNVIAPASWTTPSHASIFTGQYPIIHGAHESRDRKILNIKLKQDKDILSKILREMGYETYLFSANPLVSPRFGFTGFEHLFEISYVPEAPKISILSSEDVSKLGKIKNNIGGYSSKLKIAKLLIQKREYKLFFKSLLSELLNKPLNHIYFKFKRWPLDKGANTIIKEFKKKVNNNSKKFIFINFMEVHDPYYIGERTLEELLNNLNTNKLNEYFIKKWKNFYPKEVEYITKNIFQFINIIKKKGMFENSLIIITSDHGQLLGEHGRISHGYFLYDELLKVPLYIKLPYTNDSTVTSSIIHLPNKYFSLTKIKSLIFNLLNEDKLPIETIKSKYEDSVFAESHGIVHDIERYLTDDSIKRYSKYRIAIYYKNFKGIFNVTDWKFEEIISYENIKVTEDIVEYMKREVMKFLRTAIMAKVPKMKKWPI